MKKVFSLIALVGVFAACQPEEVKTIFESKNAQLSFKVSEVITSINGEKVTNSANTTIMVPAPITGDPSIKAGTATLSAKYFEATGSTTINYPDILADTDPVELSAIVYIPGTVGDYKIDVEPVEGDDVVVGTYILSAGKEHGYSHYDRTDWVENASDYTLFDAFTYDDIFEPEITSAAPEVYEDTFKGIVESNFESTALIFAASNMTEEGKEDEIEVPAWSLYQVVNTVYEHPLKFYVTAEPQGTAAPIGKEKDGVKNVIGYFEGKVTYSMLAKPIKEHPSHAGHGHSAGHGNGSNAGGGLVSADE